ncbi:gp53-like domain-containing protein [Novosphingobium soli]|uniref:Putative tail fiber protein gp53-like C-terminal domain-containing protein n=1 Tax=Novosphingobium soli TaxID=574956 RepID=A0ABV6D1B5_9SPHN
MATLVLKLTDAGLAAVQAASGSDPTVIESLGLTATPFDYAPTLTALPGEFKRVEVASGVASAANVTHLTAYDTSADVWTATGFGLFLDDGTLFAVHTGVEPIMSKVGLAFALLAFDIAFEADFASNIAYGNAVFAYPAATENTPGIAEIATQVEVDAGDDDRRFVTPKKLWARLQAIFQAITAEATARAGADNALSEAIGNEAGTRASADVSLGLRIDDEINTRFADDNALRNQIDTLRSRSIGGGGLVSGGGSLDSDRTLTVTEASPEDITEGSAGDKVVTPRRLGPISMTLAQNGFIRFFGFQINWGRFTADANTTTAVAFARAMNTACFSAVVSGVTNLGTGSQDNTPAVITSSITKNGFSVFNADDENDATCYIAVGT